MARINLLEEGAEGARGRKKSHEWERKPKVGRLLADRDLLSEAKAKDEEPQRADVLHIRNRLPKGSRPEGRGKGNTDKPPKPSKPKPETVNQQPSPPESDEERLARLEEKISNELTDLEQGFAKSCMDEYPKELERAINKIESKGSTVAEKQISAIRTSYIGDVKRWGLGRKLAPEKAELLGKYLELKLPVGVPEEKVENTESGKEETKEKSFSSEQMVQIRVLLEIAN